MPDIFYKQLQIKMYC